jgi:peroxiredoxin (alkyl hydroperoxide reductase subunit C)
VTLVAPGTPAPEFTLRTEDGESFTRADLEGRTTVLVFYPGAFTRVCTDQLQVYEDEVVADLRRRDVEVYAVSCDSSDSQRAFREALGVSIAQLSDFEPKGAASRAFGAYFEPAGFSNRALVVTGPDAVVRWSHLADSPGDLPRPGLLLEGVEAVAA